MAKKSRGRKIAKKTAKKTVKKTANNTAKKQPKRPFINDEGEIDLGDGGGAKPAIPG